MPNPDGVLKPGQFVRVRLHGATRPKAMIVPSRAVLEGPQGQVRLRGGRQQGHAQAGAGGRPDRRPLDHQPGPGRGRPGDRRRHGAHLLPGRAGADRAGARRRGQRAGGAPGAHPRPPAAAPAPRARSSPPRRRRPPRSKPLATHNKRGTSMFSRFFIDRPIFAAVLSIFIVIAGLAATRSLPIAQYPEIAPPVVTVLAVYPGASAEVIEQTVAAPLENAINGVEHMIYMGSTSTSNGVVTIQVTFDIGTDADQAAQRQQPRQAGRDQAAAGSAAPGRHGGEGLARRSCRCWRSSPTTAATTTSTISNYVTLNVLDQLKRVPGTTNVQIFGAKDYAMRIWLQARSPGAAAPHHRRHRARDQRAERAVRRRQGRPGADRRRRRRWSTPSPRRAGWPSRSSSRTSSCAPTPTAARCA